MDSDENIPLAHNLAKTRKHIFRIVSNAHLHNDCSEEAPEPFIVWGIRDLVNLKRKRALEEKLKQQCEPDLSYAQSKDDIIPII